MMMLQVENNAMFKNLHSLENRTKHKLQVSFEVFVASKPPHTIGFLGNFDIKSDFLEMFDIISGLSLKHWTLERNSEKRQCAFHLAACSLHNHIAWSSLMKCAFTPSSMHASSKACISFLGNGERFYAVLGKSMSVQQIRCAKLVFDASCFFSRRHVVHWHCIS
jgi:hypothetical protein